MFKITNYNLVHVVSILNLLIWTWNTSCQSEST